MKKLFFFFLALVVSVSSFAYGETKLTISSYSQKNITITIDGYNRSNGNNNNIVISDLSGGNHNVKIYEERRGLFGKRTDRLIYNANLYLKPNYETYLTVNSDGNVDVREQAIYNGGYRRNNGRGNNDPNNRGYQNKQHKKNKHGNDDYDNDADRRGGKDNRDNTNNGGWNNGNNGSYNYGMDARSFEQFKQSVRNETFENTKQSIAKQGLNSNSFTAAQIRELVQLFSFDAGKLEIAKYAYSHCVDKGNYYVINDVFAFSSSRDELARYIQSAR